MKPRIRVNSIDYVLWASDLYHTGDNKTAEHKMRDLLYIYNTSLSECMAIQSKKHIPERKPRKPDHYDWLVSAFKAP